MAQLKNLSLVLLPRSMPFGFHWISLTGRSCPFNLPNKNGRTTHFFEAVGFCKNIPIERAVGTDHDRHILWRTSGRGCKNLFNSNPKNTEKNFEESGVHFASDTLVLNSLQSGFAEVCETCLPQGTVHHKLASHLSMTMLEFLHPLGEVWSISQKGWNKKCFRPDCLQNPCPTQDLNWKWLRFFPTANHWRIYPPRNFRS